MVEHDKQQHRMQPTKSRMGDSPGQMTRSLPQINGVKRQRGPLEVTRNGRDITCAMCGPYFRHYQGNCTWTGIREILFILKDVIMELWLLFFKDFICHGYTLNCLGVK